jgi:transcriptional regulator with XRE-family HTH domain
MNGKARKQEKRAVKPLDADDQLKKLGNRIKELRIKAGYTSYEYIAYDNNISRAQFGRYENGQDIRFSSLVKVLNALGVTPKEFFSEGFD